MPSTGPQKKASPTVASLMTSQVYSCRVGDSLQVVAELMRDLDCGCLPVTDDNASPVGIITYADICNAAAREELALASIPVEATLSGEVISCSPDEPASAAVARMRDNKIHRMPVVDAEGKLIGLLSLKHLARQLVGGAELGIGAEEILAALVGSLAPTADEKARSSVTAA